MQVLFVKTPFFQKVGNGLRVETFQVAAISVEILASVWIFIVHQNSLSTMTIDFTGNVFHVEYTAHL
jgi:hypothetical protein